MNRVFVIGAGAWGTALALATFRAKAQPMIWSISSEEVDAINSCHENISRLPGIKLPEDMQATTQANEIAQTNLVILAPPAQFMRSVCETFCKKIKSNVPLIIASKGIEKETCLLMSEVVRETFPENPLLILSGPSFAHEVANKLPTAVTLASSSLSLSQKIANDLSSSHFKLYPSDDIIGTQIGGACKNIIAIACGIVDGLKLGDNARAALVTYGLAEITRLGCAMGGVLETFLGLSGIGDLTLTSLNAQSRNQTFGFALGQSIPLEELIGNKDTLTEGVHTVNGAVTLAKKFNIDMPVTFALNDLLKGSLTLEGFVETLFLQHLKMEIK